VTLVNSTDFHTRTPENSSYENPAVKQFAAAAQFLAHGLLAVELTVGGFNLIFRSYLGPTNRSAR
jgi:hypothetical protein